MVYENSLRTLPVCSETGKVLAFADHFCVWRARGIARVQHACGYALYLRHLLISHRIELGEWRMAS
jgi:hypothetical protein